MGADLIGYMVKGPLKLNPFLKEDAIKAAQNIIDLAIHSNYWAEDITEESEQPEEMPDWMWEELQNNGEITSLACCNPTAAVEDFMEFWNDPEGRDVRDSVFDHYGVKFKVIFAGEMSWGDEPSGYGYQALKQAERLGLFKVFGIQY